MKKEFISGIHNYCDRWCERCTFTSRCSIYEDTGDLSSEQLDLNNKAFWGKISSSFAKTMELLHKPAIEYGFDLTKPMTEEQEAAYKQKESIINNIVKRHILSKLCKQYQHISRPFIQKSEGFVDKTRELVDHMHMGIKSPEDVVYTVAGIGDCFDIIQWYLFFIEAKLHRALHGKAESDDWEPGNGFQKDSDGSAKIALIAIEKSMGAWSTLYNYLPSSEDVALHALSLLAQLKEKLKQEFPQATEFKRPGFDDLFPA